MAHANSVKTSSCSPWTLLFSVVCYKVICNWSSLSFRARLSKWSCLPYMVIYRRVFIRGNVVVAEQFRICAGFIIGSSSTVHSCAILMHQKGATCFLYTLINNTLSLEKKLWSFLMQFVLIRGLNFLFLSLELAADDQSSFPPSFSSWSWTSFTESLPTKRDSVRIHTSEVIIEATTANQPPWPIFNHFYIFTQAHGWQIPKPLKPRDSPLVPLIPINVVVFLFFSRGLVTFADSLVLFSHEICLGESSPRSPVCTLYSLMHTWYYYYFIFSGRLSFHDRGKPRIQRQRYCRGKPSVVTPQNCIFFFYHYY